MIDSTPNTPATDPAPESAAPERSGGTLWARFLQPPTAAWQHNSRALQSSGLIAPLVSLIAVLLGTAATAYAALAGWLPPVWAQSLLVLLPLGGIVLVAALLIRMHHKLMLPLAHLRDWALRMHSGDLSARIQIPRTGEFAELAKDINRLGEELQTLSQEMDREVRKQTERLASKSRSLEILYDVAASINISRDLDDLLKRFLHTMNDVVKARGATLRLRAGNDQMRLAASIGLDPEVIEREREVPIKHCLCGQPLHQGELLLQTDVQACSRLAGQTPFDQPTEMIAVPLQYRNRTLGVYNLFLEPGQWDSREDIHDLLISIGRHMGMAIEKARLDEDAKRMSIMQERTMLSHELHDSLAQTLASLRFQVRMLDETLVPTGQPAARKELAQIQNGLDEAYVELRALLAHCRAPYGEQGLIPAIEKSIERFRRRSNILTFLQNQWPEQQFNANQEMQVLRIIQEALSNIRKHSRAHAVRVWLRCAEDHEFIVLIEDDGVGFSGPVLDGRPGEHLGLSIMQERAQRINGSLKIESEPGEGTRVMLRFKPQDQIQPELLGLL